MPYTKTNFHKAVQTHSVIVLNRRTADIGTGVMLEYAGQYFVLTAWHIIEKTDPNDVVVHLGISGQRSPIKKERIWFDRQLDLAYMQLNRFEADIFRNHIKPIRLGPEIIRDAGKEQLRCATCGYPKDMSYVDKSSQTLKAETLLVTTYLVPPESWPDGIRQDGKDPSKHFLLKYGSKHSGGFRNQEGEEISPTDPHGLSGAAVWVYKQATENDERPDYALFGIQTGIYKRKQCLAGSFIKPLLDRVRNDYANQDLEKSGGG